MILGIGLDFITVSRIAHWLKDESLCNRFFHPDEMKWVRSRGKDAARSLAARFAAKEAFTKALGTGFAGLSLRSIRVKNTPSGQPILILEEQALERMKSIGADRAHLTLSHEKNLAAAQVILEGTHA